SELLLPSTDDRKTVDLLLRLSFNHDCKRNGAAALLRQRRGEIHVTFEVLPHLGQVGSFRLGEVKRRGVAGAAGLPVRVHQLLEGVGSCGIFVGAERDQEREVAGGRRAQVVAVGGLNFVTQGVSARLYALPAKILCALGEDDHTQKGGARQLWV